MMPSMISVVVMGRSMNSADRFIAAPVSWRHLRGVVGTLDADPAPGHEPQVTVGHDRLARLEALLHHGLVTADAIHGHRSHFHRVVSLHHDGVRALLAILDR